MSILTKGAEQVLHLPSFSSQANTFMQSHLSANMSALISKIQTIWNTFSPYIIHIPYLIYSAWAPCVILASTSLLLLFLAQKYSEAPPLSPLESELQADPVHVPPSQASKILLLAGLVTAVSALLLALRIPDHKTLAATIIIR